MRRAGAGLVACVDVGSTFTKGTLVDPTSGEMVATASVPTTAATDVLDGVAAVREALGPHAEVLACSSEGGGLRMAVVISEKLPARIAALGTVANAVDSDWDRVPS